QQALRMQSARIMEFYLAELRQLGGELSLDGRNIKISDALRTLAERSPDRSPQREEEPYRRALTGMYARLAGTAWELDKLEEPRHAAGAAPPYGSAAELVADLDIVAQSLTDNGSAALARGRLRALRRAADVFGFHLAALDLRQNSDVHERVVAELLEMAQPGTGYRDLKEDARIALLLEELKTARPLTSPHLTYSAETTAELAILRAAAEAHRLYGRESIPN